MARPVPEGAEWIEAYRHWAGRGRAADASPGTTSAARDLECPWDAAVARWIRHQLFGEELRRYEDEHGAFTDEELAAAQDGILGTAEREESASAA